MGGRDSQLERMLEEKEELVGYERGAPLLAESAQDREEREGRWLRERGRRQTRLFALFRPPSSPPSARSDLGLITGLASTLQVRVRKKESVQE